MDDYDLGLYRYVIQIIGPRNLKPDGEREKLFNTNEYGAGCVSVYKVAEGGTPSTSYDIRHLTYVGAFHLQQKEGKTVKEFMREVKEGLVKLVSEK